MRITQEQLDAFHQRGFVLIPGFLDEDELKHCQEETLQHFPTPDERLATPQRYRKLDTSVTFPYDGDTLNHVTTHPEIIAALETILGTSDVRLNKSILQAKYGTHFGAGQDQRLHNDTHPKESLAYPRDEGVYRRVILILYYTDVTVDSGPTYVVSPDAYGKLPLFTSSGRTTYSREEFPDLYENEQPMTAPAGSMLMFTASTIHRGSAVRSEYGFRLAHFVYTQSAACTWLPTADTSRTPAILPDSPLHRFLETAAPKQREMLGFPPVGSDYWNETTLEGTARLYPGMDLSPYRATR